MLRHTRVRTPARAPDVISPVISFVNDRRSHFTFYSFSGRAAGSIQRCLELAPLYPGFSAIQFRAGLSRLHNASSRYELARTCNTWTQFMFDRPFVFLAKYSSNAIHSHVMLSFFCGVQSKVFFRFLSGWNQEFGTTADLSAT